MARYGAASGSESLSGDALRTRFSIISTLVFGILLIGPEAHAATSGTSPNGVLYDGCRDYAINVSGSNPSAAEWSVDITLYAPSGDISSSDYDYGYGSSFAIAPTFHVCASEGAGLYTWSATTEWSDSDFNVVGNDSASGSLTLRRQRTRTALVVSDQTPLFNSAVSFKIKSTQETPGGFRPNAYEYVALEKKCPDTNGWVRVRQSKTTTNAYGKARLKYRYNLRSTCSVRATTLPTTNSSKSYSLRRTVNPHG
ncbi:MAG TPA: hypothetical protein VFK41_12085 [Nocardioidaceae bacterium]|nr:hypothetical protein [Nocardioidaceae bacterium]